MISLLCMLIIVICIIGMFYLCVVWVLVVFISCLLMLLFCCVGLIENMLK